MKTMRMCLAFMALACAVMAQTKAPKPRIVQVAPPPTKLAPAQISLVALPSSTSAVPSAAPQVRSVGSLTRAAMPKVPREVMEKTRTTRVNQVIKLATASPLGILKVYRNGNFADEGADYDRAGDTITFRPAAALGAGELVTVLYFQ